MKRRVGVLISGRGSDLTALLAAAADPAYPAEIALVLSNVPDAPGLDRAAESGVPSVTIDHRPFRGDRAAHETAIIAVLEAADIAFVCLAGYLRKLTPLLVDHYAGRMLNIHPSLLPAFAGLHTHERALAAGVKLHGCTVHVVTAELDAGPIVAQAAVPVFVNDTPERLAARVLVQEHALYPSALALVLGAPLWLPERDTALSNPLPLHVAPPKS